jgi:hypothetical protein
LQGCIYSGTAYLEKSGGTNNLGTGGNTFQSTATIVNSGSAYLATGYNNADTFNGDLTVTNTGTGWVAMADNASGSIFNGNITVNSTNAGANAGITFGNGPGTSVVATLASGKAITEAICTIWQHCTKPHVHRNSSFIPWTVLYI